MFPSKLYDLQLTPSLRKFNSDLESEKVMSKFSALLREDKKELFTSALVSTIVYDVGFDEGCFDSNIWHSGLSLSIE